MECYARVVQEDSRRLSLCVYQRMEAGCRELCLGGLWLPMSDSGAGFLMLGKNSPVMAFKISLGSSGCFFKNLLNEGGYLLFQPIHA
jgi:hypothetical protein